MNGGRGIANVDGVTDNGDGVTEKGYVSSLEMRDGLVDIWWFIYFFLFFVSDNVDVSENELSNGVYAASGSDVQRGKEPTIGNY